MFYFGMGVDTHSREGIAFSSDLLHWEKADEILVDVGPYGSVDSQFAHKPESSRATASSFHFYCAVNFFAERKIGDLMTGQARGITFACSRSV